jgi:hypothetical protein
MPSIKSTYEYYWRPLPNAKAYKIEVLYHKKDDFWITVKFLENAPPFFKKGHKETLSKHNVFAIRKKV